MLVSGRVFRENKKLRSEIEHLHDDLTQKSKQTSAMLDGDLKTLQFDLTERSKVSTYSKSARQHSFVTSLLQELTDLRHNHARVKKQLQEKTLEWEHARSRSEQYEADVKKLRMRVDELKQNLAASEDEVEHLVKIGPRSIHVPVCFCFGFGITRSTNKPIRFVVCSARMTSCRFSVRTCKYKWNIYKQGELCELAKITCSCLCLLRFKFCLFLTLLFLSRVSAQTSQFEQPPPHLGAWRCRPQEVQAQRPPAHVRR